jgi:hypothetical protein
MKTDRELLELAAKAAGINARWYDTTDCMMRIGSGSGLARWDPLTDDGDALRLAVKLGISIECLQTDGVTTAVQANIGQRHWNCGNLEAGCSGDSNAAARLVIVQVAADIGASL